MSCAVARAFPHKYGHLFILMGGAVAAAVYLHKYVLSLFCYGNGTVLRRCHFRESINVFVCKTAFPLKPSKEVWYKPSYPDVGGARKSDVCP